jgi:hypothetical protein
MFSNGLVIKLSKKEATKIIIESVLNKLKGDGFLVSIDTSDLSNEYSKELEEGIYPFVKNS